jgi:predicted extracellular nuclease
MLFGQVDYESQIQTIFNSNCTSCHTGNYNGGLDLTSYDNVMAGGTSGAVIVPSDHGNSILWQKVNSGVMPPGTNPDLNTSEVSLIADWIDEGALETPAVDVTDLFLSEYAEGSGNNKYLEIYNGTGASVVLTNYQIAQAVNGGGWQYYHTFTTGTSIADGDVWVIATDQADASIQAAANEILPYPSVVHHNGNDARGLISISGTDTTWIDIIGDPNNDPGTGWDVAGVTNGTQDHTLVRKSTVTSGNTDWSVSAGTTMDNSEWIVLDQDTWTYVGSHPHAELEGPVPPTISSIVIEPSSPTEADDVTVSAAITDDGTIASATLTYNTGSTDADVTMSNTTGDTYTGTIPAQTAGTTVTFSITAVDNDDSTTTSTESSYLVNPTGGEITAIYDIQYTTDSSGDSPLNGETVTISGIVTAEFWGSSSNRYLYVQDAEGPWNGVVCFEYGGWDTFDFSSSAGMVHSVAEGDSVTVTGTVDEYYNLTEIVDVTEVIIHGPAVNMISPAVVTPGQIMTGGSETEAYEGCLVEIDNVTVDNADLNNGEWSVTHGTNSVRVDDIWDYYYFPESGQALAEVVGVMTYTYSDAKLEPRLARDVVEADGAPVRLQRIQQVLYSDLMKAGEDEESDMSYMVDETVTIEGIVTMPSGLSYAGAGVKFIFADVHGGPWSAILSYDPDSAAFPTLFEGDLIQATGYIDEYSTGPANMTELFITEPINIIDFEQPLPAIDTVNTGDLLWPTEAEQWGNVMVRIEDGIVTNNDLQYEVFAVDDGTGSVLVDDDSDSIATYFETVGPPPVGSLVQSMEGWLYHHYGSNADSTAYKLCPLYVEDIEFGSGPPSITGLSREPCAPTASDNEVAVSCVILDNSTISEALVHYSIDGGDYTAVAMTSADDSTFTGVIPVANDNTVYYYITATDDGADQSEAKTSVYPNNTDHDQLGFHVSDNLTIGMVQETPWPSGNTLYEGCTVTLTGAVTADTAQYTSGYSSYAFQDGTGQWNGLVFDTEEMAIVTRGDEVSVTGLVTDNDPDWIFKFGGNTRLINATVSVTSTGNDSPSPTGVSASDLAQTAEEVESYEGVLVKLENVTVSSVNSYDWSITDASGMEALIDEDMGTMGAGIAMSELVEGQELSYIMGIFNYSFGTYKVQIRDVADIGTTVGIDDDVKVNPYEYALHDNFPNPFNPETQVRFTLGAQENVKLVIYDIMGRQVRTLANGDSFNSGFHVLNWDGRDNVGEKVATGMYIYRIKAGDFIADKKMLLVK